MATWLVTGGAGFIGSHLCDALIARRDKVVVLDDLSSGRRENLPPDVELVKGDVRDVELIRALTQRTAGCFHLAAVASVEQCQRDPMASSAVNLGGTRNLLDAAQMLNRAYPMVYASSAAIYGACDEVPIRESAPAAPISNYGVDKLSGELYGRVQAELGGAPFQAFRFFNVYGPRQDPLSPYSGVVSIFSERALSGRPLVLNGGGAQYRDFIYVGDIITALILGMERIEQRGGYDLANLCRGEAVTIADLAHIIRSAAGEASGVTRGPTRPGDIFGSLGDPSRARAALGWTPHVPTANGVVKLLRWMQQDCAA